ncbi:hypothetical protein GCM10020001_057830 [Nonomuraea salmonea]
MSGHTAGEARREAERVVERDAGAHVRAFPAVVGQREQERHGSDQVGRDALEQQGAFLERLAYQVEVELLQVAQAAVDQLGRA